MLQIKIFTFGPFETNTYVVSDEQHILLVDPACYTDYEQQELENYINRQSIVPRQSSNRQLVIVATHGHLDHLWGAKWATEQWQTPVLIHEADLPMVEAMQQQYDLFRIHRTAETFAVERLNEAADLPFTIIETPGHTPGSVCLYWPEEKVLLSGDTLFCMGYGRTDLPGGDTAQLICSLSRLFDLPSDVTVYPGHGETTTIGAEKR
ncbi:MAG: MBL fold metallo-hydrolase [Paludibacteraceae bacterium]|nr:MBL fold metallo-hydrolase [Paludibacteraceae bacterium]